MPFEFIEDAALREKANTEFNTQIESLKLSLKDEFTKETEGLRTSQQQLLDEKKKLQEKYKNIDPDEAIKALQLVKGNEEVKLLSEGKLEEVVQKRLSSIQSDHETKITEMNSQLDGLAGSSIKYKTMYQSTVIDTALRAEALNAGILPAAIGDVLNQGKPIFILAEDEFTVEARDANGKLRKTDDEKVLTVANWVETLKKSHPHYWPPSKAAGFNPGGAGVGDADELQAQINAAANTGNSVLFRQLREKQRLLTAGKTA